MQLPKETTRTVVVGECTPDDPSGPTASTIARKPQRGQMPCQDQHARLPPQAHTHHQAKACRAKYPGPPSNEGGFCCCSMYVVRCSMLCVRCPFCSCKFGLCSLVSYAVCVWVPGSDVRFCVRCFCATVCALQSLFDVCRSLFCVRHSMFVVLRSLFDVRHSLSICSTFFYTTPALGSLPTGARLLFMS